MDRIYDIKTKKLKEVSLSPGEQHYLMKLNNKLIQEQLLDIQIKARGEGVETPGQ